MKRNVADDIKTVLGFYAALGFERLPVEVPREGDVPVSGMSTHACTVRGLASHSSKLSAAEKQTALASLRHEIGDCQRCRLSKGRTHIVFGEGNADASLMFIGEGPGEDEDIQARPFVGKAGQTLRSLITKMGLKESDVYIANVVKCRPPSNRTPMPDEIATCIPFLRRQIEIISPEIIMLLGNVALQGVMNNPNLRITAARGRFTDCEGILVMPTFHPSYLLRNPKEKWLVWGDAQKVLEALKREGTVTGERG